MGGGVVAAISRHTRTRAHRLHCRLCARFRCKLAKLQHCLHHLVARSARGAARAALLVLHRRPARIGTRQIRTRASLNPFAFPTWTRRRDRPGKRSKVTHRQPVARKEQEEQSKPVANWLSVGVVVVWQRDDRRGLLESQLACESAAVLVPCAICANPGEHPRQSAIRLRVPAIGWMRHGHSRGQGEACEMFAPEGVTLGVTPGVTPGVVLHLV